MSGSSARDTRAINMRLFEQNYAALLGNTVTVGQAAIEFPDKALDKLIYSFEVSVPGQNRGRGCSVHINLTPTINPAHLTVVGWNDARKINYWFHYTANNRIEPCNPPHGCGKIAKDSIETFAKVPGEIAGAARHVISACFRGVYDTVED